jgi:uncharacterized protein YdeI (YjbR/CyaY-like superfamily)
MTPTSTSRSSTTTKTTKFSGFAELQPRSRKAWRAWLQKHHASSSGVWLVYAKKHTGIPSLTYNDAVEEALCFGWIDSLLHPVDDQFFKQVFTPRKPKSAWSALNRTRVERIVAAGLMTPPGLAMIELAKKTGTWGALRAAEDLELPDDLAGAIKASAKAGKHWPTYTVSQRKMLLYNLRDAKRPETRAKRIARIIAIVEKKISFADLRRNPSLVP